MLKKGRRKNNIMIEGQRDSEAGEIDKGGEGTPQRKKKS